MNTFTRRLFVFTLFFCIIYNKANTQSISPVVLNGGGSTAIVSSANLEWSLSESVSIAYFLNGGLVLNTGFLQPNTNIVTGINEFGPAVFGTQITIGPNPTTNLLLITARFNQLGNLSFQLLDAKSVVVLTQEAGTIYNNYEKSILLEAFPAGVLYVRVYFKPITGNAKTGIYKIIKL